MKNLITALAIATGMLSACQFSVKNCETNMLPKNTALTQDVFIPEKEGYTLVWEDQFEGLELDTTKWKVRGTGPRRIGYNDPSMVKVNNGKLHCIHTTKPVFQN